jgi:hypothetical protein
MLVNSFFFSFALFLSFSSLDMNETKIKIKSHLMSSMFRLAQAISPRLEEKEKTFVDPGYIYRRFRTLREREISHVHAWYLV